MTDHVHPSAEVASDAQVAEWVEDAIRHYQQHGFYRPEDLYRLFGDPVDGVDFGEPNLPRCSWNITVC